MTSMKEVSRMAEDKCARCKNRDVAVVPYYVYEGTSYRFERSQKALILVTITSLILSLVVVGGASFVVKMAKTFATNEHPKV